MRFTLKSLIGQTLSDAERKLQKADYKILWNTAHKEGDRVVEDAIRWDKVEIVTLFTEWRGDNLYVVEIKKERK